METLSMNKEKYLKLKKYHDTASKDGSINFPFEGVLLVTSYAKYLLEYLKGIYEPEKS